MANDVVGADCVVTSRWTISEADLDDHIDVATFAAGQNYPRCGA
ncbi:hypothetical protein RESH_03509 [Rhodopirellula europaea SH398]|uniref:Uncharacterized protein n=1 Tax=Rhodopirellula europaea SH398 TaxID=1263868 RepID=M5S2N8_9BACT|nr:hypothetical protein RESH_03509 [Rhodopirellula europaea SH398]